MEVLAVALPLESLVERFSRRPLRQRLADAQPPARRVPLALRIAEPADPSHARVVGPMASEHVVDLIDETQCELGVALVAGGLCEAEEVADRERVRPQVPLRRLRGAEAGAFDEAQHELRGLEDGSLSRRHELLCGLTAPAAA